MEQASDTLLDGMLPAGSGKLPPPATVPELAASLHILVAGNPPVGFARLKEVDGQAHLEQLSVHPGAAGAGVGRALVEAALGWARQRGYTSMTLCTFAEVPFNAPFYASCGFEIVTHPVGGLAALRTHERQLGLDALGERVAMRRDLFKRQGQASRPPSSSGTP
ncbi:GNAT family N-acetyltransferase [Arthrobacter sp. zg-Y1171]|uniref:GNAT family N-acetyltransferase n=1 Tax=Arthrobacter sp. zg-Y1171 TaxID=2964610 RepID=UPI0021082530|nr:GNAT family N-acetyltransferase [Arthrobacter sp. zg-Y1171]MCQ1995168.1 GNAT family N-acetyltransferase [Arthrobacter sp. zg-Y1171]UWX80788.1 GNAT family N-acetyltransferase [Arthrobacter sp. zg-Y1171]